MASGEGITSVGDLAADAARPGMVACRGSPGGCSALATKGVSVC